MENKLKHLEFIQSVISRMASNMFLLRGWSITLISALIAFFATKSTPNHVGYLLATILITFWISDGFFLRQERLFRSLYDKVRCVDESMIDFSMDTSEFKSKSENRLFYAMFSFSIYIFYIPLGVVCLTATCLIK